MSPRSCPEIPIPPTIHGPIFTGVYKHGYCAGSAGAARTPPYRSHTRGSAHSVRQVATFQRLWLAGWDRGAAQAEAQAGEHVLDTFTAARIMPGDVLREPKEVS
jgi:hypothetical protein